MPTFVHIDISAEKVERAKSFYETIFGWKFYATPDYPDFYLFETAGDSGTKAIGGGMGRRGSPDQRITCYIGVDSIERYLPKIGKMWGKISMPYTEVPGFDALAVCVDTEGNTFGLWEGHREL